MVLADFLGTNSVALDLVVESREEVLREMVGRLGMEPRPSTTLLRLLERRELLGSTGIGRGIAVPHCRSLVVRRLQISYARLRSALPWDSPDHIPVTHVFMLMAPSVEVRSQYLPALAGLARLARAPDSLRALAHASGEAAVRQLLAGVTI